MDGPGDDLGEGCAAAAGGARRAFGRTCDGTPGHDARAVRRLHRTRTRATAPQRGRSRALSQDALPRRVAELAQRYRLPDPAAAQLGQLLRLLSEEPDAPTTIRDPDRVLQDHLADSLVALELDAVRTAQSFVDLGSGAGLPGLPLAIALPQARFVLLESVGRKCAFVERAVSTCALRNVDVVQARAEAYEAVAQFDLAVARAVAPLDVV